jgi:hypothetical protein
MLLSAALLAASVAALPPHQRDLESLLEASPIVARGRALSRSETSPADGFELEVLALLKGSAPERIRVLVENERPLRPEPGEEGLFFLAPSSSAPERLACIQSAAERWTIEPGSEAQTDAFVRGLLQPSGGIERYLAGLANPSVRLASFAAQRIALRARAGEVSAEQHKQLLVFVAGAAGSDEVKAGLVQSLGDAFSLEEVLDLIPRAPEQSRTRAALLAMAAARADGAAPALADRARGALAAARAAESPEVALAAARGLASLGDEGAIPAARQALSSPDPRTRAEAVLVLGQLAGKGSRAAREQLKALSSDSDPLVRTRVKAALRETYLTRDENACALR